MKEAMSEKEVEYFVRQIIYKMSVQEAIDAVYEIVNKKKLVHEKQKEQKIGCEKSGSFAVMVDSKYRDLNGERIWFPKDGKPYHDRALGRTFNNISEKCQHMKEKGIVMDGSSDPTHWPIEAGDMRNKSYRKEVGMSD